jgi:hypothetical protein
MNSPESNFRFTAFSEGRGTGSYPISARTLSEARKDVPRGLLSASFFAKP